MNNSKLALIALLGGALMAFGCDDGDGVTGGTGGGGPGGTGGAIDPLCQATTERCESGTTGPIVECCDTLAAPPVQTNACTGDESTVNPASCMGTGTMVTHKLTLLALENDCNAGFDLDSCDGYTCVAGSINDRSEGLMGHDNGLASIALNVEELAMIDLTGVQQALNNSLCGLTDDPAMGTCTDTGSCSTAGTACTNATNCPAGETCDGATACANVTDCTTPATCDLDDDDCGADIPALELYFDVEASAAGGCANVRVRSVGLCSDGATACTSADDCAGTETCDGGGTSQVVLNLTDPTNGVCAGTGTCSVTVATTCASADDCPATETCDFTACAANADCDVQGGCTDTGACTDTGTCSVTVATMCAIDSDCPATETCTGATACAIDDECTDVACVGATACAADADCAGQEVCVGAEVGVCEGDTGCMSGQLGSIPVTLAGAAGVLGNAVVRMTVSPEGFSDGLLGASADSETAIAIATAISDVAAGVVDLTFDINSTVTQDTSAMCDALSMTLEVGGAAEIP